MRKHKCLNSNASINAEKHRDQKTIDKYLGIKINKIETNNSNLVLFVYSIFYNCRRFWFRRYNKRNNNYW